MSPIYTVIADDLSGAAEMGGVAFRHGLTAAICSGDARQGEEEVVVRDLNTRSRPEEEVASVLEQAFIRRLSGAPCGRLYKKVDSVLRGHILLELTHLLRMTARRRALLVPINPLLGRVIEDGMYRIQGVPLHETDFRNDPQHPTRTSAVAEILRPRPNLLPVTVAPLGERLPEAGVVVGEAKAPEDLREWARQLDSDTLPAGGAAFFEAILKEAGFAGRETGWVTPAGRQLLVSGSASAASHAHVVDLQRRGVPVLPMPDPLFESKELPSDTLGSWARETIAALERSPLVVVTIGHPVAVDRSRGDFLTARLARLSRLVLDSVQVAQLWIEGGETASSLVNALGWRRLRVCGQIQGKVVQLVPEDASSPVLNLKPGSYPWPDQLVS